jgi:hypothetical protein
MDRSCTDAPLPVYPPHEHDIRPDSTCARVFDVTSLRDPRLPMHRFSEADCNICRNQPRFPLSETG